MYSSKQKTFQISQLNLTKSDLYIKEKMWRIHHMVTLLEDYCEYKLYQSFIHVFDFFQSNFAELSHGSFAVAVRVCFIAGRGTVGRQPTV